MYWFEIWNKLERNQTPYYGDLSSYQKAFLRMLISRRDAINAIRVRRSLHSRKYNYERKLNSSVLPNFELMPSLAEYYERYYSLGEKLSKPKRKKRDDSYYSNKYQRYDKIISNLYMNYDGVSDDEFIATMIYARIPTSGFDKDEIIIWKSLYKYVRTCARKFVLTRKNDHKEHLSLVMSYNTFSIEYPNYCNEYSCKDRFIVPNFLEWCNKHSIDISSPTKVYSLLRYDYEQGCFTSEDLRQILGTNYLQKKEDFFLVVNRIRNLGKKK